MMAEIESRVSFNCANCDARLNAKTIAIGRQIQCIKCGTVITVPGVPETNAYAATDTKQIFVRSPYQPPALPSPDVSITTRRPKNAHTDSRNFGTLKLVSRSLRITAYVIACLWALGTAIGLFVILLAVFGAGPFGFIGAILFFAGPWIGSTILTFFVAIASLAASELIRLLIQVEQNTFNASRRS